MYKPVTVKTVIFITKTLYEIYKKLSKISENFKHINKISEIKGFLRHIYNK